MTAPGENWLGVGEEVTLDNCEREPIHLPGRVQAHGAMLVVARDGLRVVQASVNAAKLLGLNDDVRLQGQLLVELLGASALETVLALPSVGPPAVRPELITLPGGGRVLVQCFEPAPELLGLDLEDATLPLPGSAAMSRYAARATARLAATESESDCLEVAIDLLQEATGFDRVWAYQFEADGHGVVVAETRADRDLDPFLGLHFPESDIPAQARQMYLTAGVRLIGDSHAGDVPLVPEINPLTGGRTDLSGSDLRGVSPMHVRYLRNMGVRTSMSVPIVVFGRLWGLVSAHSYRAPQRVPPLTRSRCETLGMLTSMQLTAVSRSRAADEEAAAERHLRELAASLGAAQTATDGLTAGAASLLGICRADGAVIALAEEHRFVGATIDNTQVEALVDALEQTGRDVVACDHVAELDGAPSGIAPTVAGALGICLSHAQRHWVIWTRSEHVQHVTWANRDRELVRREPSQERRLGARESFELWAEGVRGKSMSWSAADVRAASEVRAAIGTYAFQQAQQLAERASELARVNEELDAFAYSAAHDLQQPVRAIAMRTEFLIEDVQERLTAEELESARAVLRLTDHMGGLVQSLLRYAKLDYAAHQPQRISLATMVGEVRELLGDAARGATITQDDAVVEADPDVLRQVLFNLVWNAVKYCDRQPVIHIGATKRSARPPGSLEHVSLNINPETDPDIIYVRDNGIGIPHAELETVFGLFRRLHDQDGYGGGSGAGLALCRRLVQRGGGTIWATSTLGKGSTFYFTTGNAPTPAAGQETEPAEPRAW